MAGCKEKVLSPGNGHSQNSRSLDNALRPPQGGTVGVSVTGQDLENTSKTIKTEHHYTRALVPHPVISSAHHHLPLPWTAHSHA